jgi:hypothetical protein
MWVLDVFMMFQGRGNLGRKWWFGKLYFLTKFGSPKPKFKSLAGLTNECKSVDEPSQGRGIKSPGFKVWIDGLFAYFAYACWRCSTCSALRSIGYCQVRWYLARWLAQIIVRTHQH